MELADQFGGHSQAVIGTSPRLLGRLPRDVPRQEAEDLPALLVHAPEPRRAVPAGPFQRLQQPVHETRIPSGPPANRVTDPDHFGHEPATQQFFRHTASVPPSANEILTRTSARSLTFHDRQNVVYAAALVMPRSQKSCCMSTRRLS